jgi:hypothetical protein
MMFFFVALAGFAGQARADSSQLSANQAVQLLQQLRSASGIASPRLSVATPLGCGISAADFRSADPFPGHPERLIAALAPQAVSYGHCLNATGFRASPSATGQLYSFPADGATISLDAPILLFASGTWVDSKASDGSYQGTSLTLVDGSLTRSRDGATIQLSASTADFHSPGLRLLPASALDPGTAYQLAATVSNGSGLMQITVSFHTSGASGVKAAVLSSTTQSSAVVLGTSRHVSASLHGLQLTVTFTHTGPTRFALHSGSSNHWQVVTHTVAARHLTVSLSRLFGPLRAGTYDLVVRNASDTAILQFTVA